MTEHPDAGTVAVGRFAYLPRSVDVDGAEDDESPVVRQAVKRALENA